VHLALCIALSAGVAVSAAPAQSAPPPLDVVLSRMFVYVEQFMRDLGAMVAEEEYVQSVRQATFGRGDARRELKSDFLLVDVPGQGWTPFRDVFEADGRAVRDRQDRLTSLFLSGTTAGALEQARRIMDEGARYNLGAGTRNINVPTLALMFLGPDMRSGVRFTEAKPDRPGIRIIEFFELRRPTLITTTGNRDLPANGRMWVDEATGAITKTELHAEDTGVDAEVVVSFEVDAALGKWVPKRMDDRFKRRGDQSEVRGVATYSRFRRFQVSTSEEVASPDSGGKP